MYLNTITCYNKMNLTVFLLPLIQITQLLNPAIYNDFIVRISNTTYALTEYMNKESINMLNIYYPIMSDDMLDKMYDDDNRDDEEIIEKIIKDDSDEWMI